MAGKRKAKPTSVGAAATAGAVGGLLVPVPEGIGFANRAIRHAEGKGYKVAGRMKAAARTGGAIGAVAGRARTVPGMATIGAGAAGGALGAKTHNRIHGLDKDKKKRVKKNMTESAFGVDHGGEVSKKFGGALKPLKAATAGKHAAKNVNITGNYGEVPMLSRGARGGAPRHRRTGTAITS